MSPWFHRHVQYASHSEWPTDGLREETFHQWSKTKTSGSKGRRVSGDYSHSMLVRRTSYGRLFNDRVDNIAEGSTGVTGSCALKRNATIHLTETIYQVYNYVTRPFWVFKLRLAPEGAFDTESEFKWNFLITRVVTNVWQNKPHSTVISCLRITSTHQKFWRQN